MEQIKLSDFKIIPDFNSIRNLDISDDEYFSSKYSNYISNSRLRYINPDQGGSFKLFKANPKLSSSALALGSSIHELLLQPESFELVPKISKPGAKLGLVMDFIEKFLESGLDLEPSIEKACLEAGYFVNNIDAHKQAIKKEWEVYSTNLFKIKSLKKDKEQIIVCDKDWDLINNCVESCKDNEFIWNKLHPKDLFDNPIETHFEDALFIDFIVIYKQKHCTTLKFKLKIDNWTIDFDNKTITLNDLKTTGKSVSKFMDPEMSFEKFHYNRQMAAYSSVLWYYCMRRYGISKETGWKLNANMLVVETIPNYWSRCYFVNSKQLRDGQEEFENLLKRVCYAELFGYDNEVEFV